jgi:hypothetical protein
MSEITNKIAESGLISLDLADFKADLSKIKEFDIASCLWQGLVLKEKDFREFVKEFDWQTFKNQHVYVICSADAIVPTWAYMLVASKLEEVVDSYLIGTKTELEKQIIKVNISNFDLDLPQYSSKKYIIKGCSEITDPAFAMTELMKKIQPSAQSIMYGEPCSTVPIYKKPKEK